MADEKKIQELEAISGPIIKKLLSMVGAARNAFNRHRRQSMAELQGLKSELDQEIHRALTKVVALAARKSGAEQACLLRLQSILNHLHIIGDTLGALTDPIQKKIQEGVLFSDKAVTQTNFLFDHHAGLLRSLLDIIKTDNEFLKKYVVEEGRKLIEACIVFATEHEARMIEGLCLPQAAPIFLSILDRMRNVGQHEVDIANILAQKS
jgi:Na+/phosphate symporter